MTHKQIVALSEGDNDVGQGSTPRHDVARSPRGTLARPNLGVALRPTGSVIQAGNCGRDGWRTSSDPRQ